MDCALDAIGVTDGCRNDVSLAISEVCANVVQHAHDSVDYTVTVTATANRCTIDVCDSGTGLAPPPASAGPRVGPTSENGRGLAIVRAVMDAVQVVAGPSGVAIHMVKRLIFGNGGYLHGLPNRT